MIHHVSLETRPADVDAALAFWALLGFTRVDPPPSLAARAAWLAHGPTQIHLLYADEPTVMPEGHVAVVLDDYAATLARLRTGGFTPEPRKEHWGAPRAYAVAPGGHRVELMAAPPPDAGAYRGRGPRRRSPSR